MTAEGGTIEALRAGRVALGIELGSTRIKACLVHAEDPTSVIGVGAHAWENAYVDGVWTYDLADVWSGLRAAYAGVVDDVRERHGTTVQNVSAIGVSAMMHGYLAFDAHGELLVPFRTWRNTSTEQAAAELSEAFGTNIPLRWSIAHLHQALLDDEPHLGRVASVTTLAGYVHARLTGRHVLGVGDASGMFPIDSTTGGYDADLIARYDTLAAGRLPVHSVSDLLPEVLTAGTAAGALTSEGAALLDPTGGLRPGSLLCPPEGDAGTGMVATNAVAPRTGNVSAGTSIFAMVVLERPLASAHEELDLVTTPDGSPVAMVHCNNGASELGAWAGVFGRFAADAGRPMTDDEVFRTLFDAAADADPDAGGLLAFNQVAGEPILRLPAGRPLFVRTPDSRLTLGNVARAHVYGAFAALAIGMRVLRDEGAVLDRMLAHGGLFRTAGVPQRLLAAALDAPVGVAATASEGGAWGIAVLAAYAQARSAAPHAPGSASVGSLPAFLDDHVFAHQAMSTAEPDPADVAGFTAYLERYRAGLAVESVALTAL